MIRKILLTVSLLFAFSCTTLYAKTKIKWWHAMGGPLQEWVKDLAKEYNASQDQYEIVPVYKGSYAETLNASISAFRTKKHPHIMQVFEVGTATVMSAKGAIYPVHQLMKDNNHDFNTDDFLPAIASYYSTSEGNMLSLPFNSSTPVLYYNKQAFEKAGLDPNTPPKTWEDVKEYTKKLQKVGYKCGITSGWQSWVLLENFSAWHDLPLGTKENGYKGLDTEFVFNSPEHVTHFQKLADWQKENIFEYGGRRDKPLTKFSSQECAMFMNSSGAYSGIKKASSFDFGVGMLPYWKSLKDQPQNSIIGGATLWVLKGHDSKDYKGVAEFIAFLSSADVNAKSHQRTGYLPVTKSAYNLTKESGFYKNDPGKEIAIKQLSGNQPTKNSRGLRFGNFVQMRDVINEELENVWSGKKDAKEALTNAVKRGNKLLRDFEKRNK